MRSQDSLSREDRTAYGIHRVPLLLITSGLVGLSACGSGEDAPTAAAAAPGPSTVAISTSGAAPALCVPPPEGTRVAQPFIGGGTITGIESPSFILMAPGDGTKLRLFYGPDLAANSRITGYASIGAGSWCSGRRSWTTFNGIDEARGPVYLQTAIASNGLSFTGSLRYESGTYTLAGGAVPGSTYDAKATPELSAVVGTWSLTDERGTGYQMTVATDGLVSATYKGCTLNGTLSIGATRTLNYFDLSLQRKCPTNAYADMPFTGVGLLMPMADGTRQFLVWFENDNWDYEQIVGIARR